MWRALYTLEQLKGWNSSSTACKTLLLPRQDSHLFSRNEITFIAKPTVLPTAADRCDKGNAESPESGRAECSCRHRALLRSPQHQRNHFPANPGITGNEGRAKGAPGLSSRCENQRGGNLVVLQKELEVHQEQGDQHRNNFQDEILPVALGPA